jgi:hypothetical protein
MIPLIANPNVDNSDSVNYPDGRIKNNTGTGNGTPVNRNVYGDIHSNISKMMRLYNIIPNGLPDNESNQYQIIEALRALATKNSIVADINTSGGVLVASMKISHLIEGEKMYCKSSCNYTDETSIKGTNVTTTFAITVVGDFKIGEYVELIKTNTGVELRRVIDQANINAVVASLNFLKAASDAEDIAGTIVNKASTPASHLAAFVNRVIGATSGSYLATALRNGLYPKEHFTIVAGLVNPVRNIGTASGIDLNNGASGTTYTVTGNIVSATKTNSGDDDGSIIRIVVANTMSNTSYYVRTFIESLNSGHFVDSSIFTPTFKPINATTFDVCIKEFGGVNQNLRIHFEVVKI